MTTPNDIIFRNVRDMNVYKLAFSSAMEIFKLTKRFPIEEKYSLTDQVRRSSRSVCSNLAESWFKRKYIAAFISKLRDSVQEACETQTWLGFALECGYLNKEDYTRIMEQYEHIIAQILTMEQKAHTFCKPI